MKNNSLNRLASRWYPKGAMAINHPDGLGVAYVAPLDSERWQVAAYRGTAGKPDFNYSYKTRELAEKNVEEWFTSLLAHKVRIAEYRKTANAPHSLKPGDIITNSWGYDQTNVDWYRVTRTSKNFVWLKPIAAESVLSEGHAPMSGYCVPAVDTHETDPSKWGFRDLDKPEEMHKAACNQYGNSVCFKYGAGSKWDGKAMYESWYA